MLTRLAIAIACCLTLLGRAADAPAPISADAAALLGAVRASQSRLVVVNVWATWCIPCRLEFPHFVKLRQQYLDKGVDVLFVSTDFEDSLDAARQFLTRQGVTWPSYLKTGKDDAFIQALHPDWSGALPATFIFRDGQRVDFWEKAVDYAELEAHVAKLLD